jgi:hypothetical protein
LSLPEFRLSTTCDETTVASTAAAFAFACIPLS